MKRIHIKNKFLRGIVRKCTSWYFYCAGNVWKDQRAVWYVDLIKTINLSVTSYLDKNIQSRASSLTYSTLLAIVPVLALIFAIARGFGFQEIIQNELHVIFPAQATVINTALDFVDRYLETASGGLFVGIGILFLLWTMFSLLRKIEVTFNYVWGVKKGRSPYRMVTDYTTIVIILPVLLICSGGISLFMSSFVQDHVFLGVLSPVVSFLLDVAPWLLTCLFFACMYSLVPYTKVKFRYALISGLICGSLYQLLQYVFVSGQMYVSRYNAIYGSFSFLPLFLIWLYMTWLICISGVVLTYSSQNIFRFSFTTQIRNMSFRYLEELTLYVTLIIVSRFEAGKPPYTKYQIMETYNIPIRIVNMIVDKLVDAGILSMVTNEDDSHAYQPAQNLSRLTVGEFILRYRNIGVSNFIPELRNLPLLNEIECLLLDSDEARRVKLADLIQKL